MFIHLPFDADLPQYEIQARDLLDAVQSGDSQATGIVHRNHPRFLDANIPWLPRKLADGEIQSASLDCEDARLALARWYGFRDWPALGQYAAELAGTSFEGAAEAVVQGDAIRLRALLTAEPELVRARSRRVTKFDPPVHRATLLHYTAANGVEAQRQKTPPNAVEIARILLQSGADADAPADMYGASWSTMGLLVSSCHPAQAGVQIDLVHVLVDHGAEVQQPLLTALIHGYPEAAEALVMRGARADTLPAAAGMGNLEEATSLLPGSDSPNRHRALALAAQHGRSAVVELLLNAGEDPNRFGPDHKHATPLHQAALNGHLEVVQLLVRHGARLDIKDTIHQATPLEWARHGGRTEVEADLS